MRRREGFLKILGSVPVAFCLGLIRGYQALLSPLLGPTCRFTPTCSAYAAEALRKYGLCAGLWKTARRLARCHPFGGSGYDPP